MDLSWLITIIQPHVGTAGAVSLVLSIAAGIQYWLKRGQQKISSDEFKQLIEAKCDLLNITASLQLMTNDLGRVATGVQATMGRVEPNLQVIANHYNRVVPRGVCRNMLNIYLDHFRMSIICWYHRNSCPNVCSQPLLPPQLVIDQISETVATLHQEMYQQLSGVFYADGKSLASLLSVSICEDVILMLKDHFNSGRPYFNTAERFENYISRSAATATELLEKEVEL